jgi:hypothetical protein
MPALSARCHAPRFVKGSPNVFLRSIIGGVVVLGLLGAIAIGQPSLSSPDQPRPRLLDPVFVPPGPDVRDAQTSGRLPDEAEAFPRPKLLGPVASEPKSEVLPIEVLPISVLPPAQAPAVLPPAQPPAASVQAPRPTAPQAQAPAASLQAQDAAAYPSRSEAVTEFERSRSLRVWVDAEYLLWWMRGDSLPPLVTTSPPGTPQAQAGVLGAPGTTVLFGGSTESGQALSGGSITLGYWFNDCRTCGIEANFFMLGSQVTNFNAASNGQTILARPFFDVTTGQQGSQIISFPGLVSGQVGVSDSSNLLGAGIWLRHNWCADLCTCNPYRLDGLVGFRYLRLRDDLSIGENLLSTDPNSPIPVGTTFALSDQFTTHNNFYGPDFGLTGEIHRGRWVLSASAHVALGVTSEEVDINGSTTVTVPGGTPVVNPGGLLALQSNIGHFSRSQFAVVPEVGVKLGYQVTPRLRLQMGYDFLYWSQVARAGNQIDTSINPNLLPPVNGPVAGALRPAVNIQGTSFWAQGISFGVLFNF